MFSMPHLRINKKCGDMGHWVIANYWFLAFYVLAHVPVAPQVGHRPDP